MYQLELSHRRLQSEWLKQQKLIFSQFRGWKSKIKVPGRLVSGDTFFPAWKWLLCPHMSFPLCVGGVCPSSYKDVVLLD